MNGTDFANGVDLRALGARIAKGVPAKWFRCKHTSFGANGHLIVVVVYMSLGRKPRKGDPSSIGILAIAGRLYSNSPRRISAKGDQVPHSREFVKRHRDNLAASYFFELVESIKRTTRPPIEILTAGAHSGST